MSIGSSQENDEWSDGGWPIEYFGGSRAVLLVSLRGWSLIEEATILIVRGAL